MKTIVVTLFSCLIFFIGSCQEKKEKHSENEPSSQRQIRKQRVESITIPMDLSTRRPIVELMINGKGPYKFIFDTGSMTHVIDERLQSEFGFKVVGEDPLGTPGSDKKLTSKRIEVPKVSFSGTNLSQDLVMNVIDIRAMLPVDGILSSIFFKDYLLTMDYPNSKLGVAIGELDEVKDNAITFLQKPRVVNLNLDVNGEIVEAHIDTGSPGGISLPYSLKNKLTFKRGLQKGHTISTPVASFQRWDAELEGDIKIGGVLFKNPKVALVEGFEYANLGFEVVKDLRTTIDRKNSLIKFERVKPVVVNHDKLSKKEVQSNSYIGEYEGSRKVWENDNGELVYKNAASPIDLKLIEIEKDLYAMKIPDGVRTPMEIPKIKFLRNENKLVIGLSFIYKDGRIDGPHKKVSE
ncbi:pepsin/retropepsin-like aspartic protease family protein [Psychroserpens luteolus]|uniref:pepsin/retropepsin-like aspartic protease family protein n=1 Tax=Psychroserpens luteolus TaxID=2855840 RepID=UPI001E4F9E63|nr:pepsin/retropepsin-like aspartic protease family protein [Psychroserpens luteolus]MCD2257726.1 aspartyl protease family protein [Psychroserpens luteolus]